MATTPTPWKVTVHSDGEIVIATVNPLIEGSELPLLIARVSAVTGFAGDARDNAELIVNAANAHHGLLARLHEIEAACRPPFNAAQTCAHVCMLARKAIDEVKS